MRRLSAWVVTGWAMFLGASTLAHGQAQPDKVVKVGLAAMISPKETMRFYADMLMFVGQRAGVKIQVVQKPSYSEMDLALESGEVDLAFICSGPYVRDHDKFGAELLVAPQSNGKAFYHSYILVPKGSTATELKDLKGKNFGFTDPHSNTGKLVPTYLIAKRFKQTPEQFFGAVTFTNSHDKSIEAVNKGQIDGVAVDSLIFDFAAKKTPARVKDIKILEKSAAYGIPPVVATHRLDASVKARLKSAFLAMHQDPKGMAILDEMLIDKFIVPVDKNYDSVREMEKWLGTQK